jgi:hypothetical protein
MNAASVRVFTRPNTRAQTYQSRSHPFTDFVDESTENKAFNVRFIAGFEMYRIVAKFFLVLLVEMPLSRLLNAACNSPTHCITSFANFWTSAFAFVTVWRIVITNVTYR